MAGTGSGGAGGSGSGSGSDSGSDSGSSSEGGGGTQAEAEAGAAAIDEDQPDETASSDTRVIQPSGTQCIPPPPPQQQQQQQQQEQQQQQQQQQIQNQAASSPSSPPRTPTRKDQQLTAGDSSSSSGSSSGDDDEEDEDEEDEEPLLKYTALTKNQAGLYRNGDSVSNFMAAGDKMFVGTHNGYVHVFALPSFKTLKTYRAHSASITALSISPYPPPLPTSTTASHPSQEQQQQQRHNGTPESPKSRPEGAKSSPQSRMQVPNTPSNNIHIATSSIDGHVVVQSLVDARDVLRRNFGRPVQTVAVSPDYKNDRTYLSGGTAALLIRTVGGAIGKTSTSTTVGGASATAAGWLGSVGLGSDEGKDTILHSGEGKINTIKWSLSGKYVVWVNEQGIKLLRSNMHFDNAADTDLAWKRMSHLDRPNRHGWDEMAGVWKARVEWVDEDGLELDAEIGPASFSRSESRDGTATSEQKPKKVSKNRVERLLIGWGGSIWVMDVHPGQSDPRASAAAKLGRLDVVTILRTDCTISGLSLYTPTLLLILAYITPDEKDESPQPKASPGTPSGGRRRRRNALRPEMRIIDIRTKEEVSIADTLSVSRFDSLTSADYHLDTLPVIRKNTKATNSKGALEVMGELGSNLYGGIWDVAMYPKHLLGSGASVLSAYSDKVSSKLGPALSPAKIPDASLNPALLTRGIKIFVHSPFDCVLATKPTIVDHLHWLEAHDEFEAAWKLIDERPESCGDGMYADSEASSPPGTPAKTTGSLQDFFTDDTSVITTKDKFGFYSHAAKEKRRLGNKWVSQLVQAGDWKKAGDTIGKVIDTVKGLEAWYWKFAQEGRFSEIVPHIPTDRLPNQPLLPPTVYEHVLIHYIASDPPRFAELLEIWSTDLFDAAVVISSIESRLSTGEVRQNSVEDGQKGRFWRILHDGLARLYLATGRHRDALREYVRLQDAESALALIKTQHLADAVANDIPSLISLRIPAERLTSASTEELDEASTDIIQLLVSEAYQGIITPSSVISQLQAKKDLRPFLFFYLRSLWTGLDSSAEPLAPVSSDEDPGEILSAAATSSPQTNRFGSTVGRSAARELDESRALVNDAADTALELFAVYSRPIFASFLRISNSYTLSKASGLCEKHDFVPELVYLLAKEGRARRALNLILDRLGNIARAIAFAREQADAELWEDLVRYSLNRPEFVKVLLEEAGSAGGPAGADDGTSLDPVALVRRIPDGMEIDGLEQALGRMLREFELRASISEGVLRVYRGEAAGNMQTLRKGQKMGIKFDIQPVPSGAHQQTQQEQQQQQNRPNGRQSAAVTKGSTNSAAATIRPAVPAKHRKRRRRRHPELVQPGQCAACGEFVLEDEPKTLIAFPCSHVFHLPCLLLYEAMPPEQEDQEQYHSYSTHGSYVSTSKPASARPFTANSANGNGRGDTDNANGDESKEPGDEDDDNSDDGSDSEADLGLPEPEHDPEYEYEYESESRGPRGGVGGKVRYAKLIRGRVAGGCPLTLHAAAAA